MVEQRGRPCRTCRLARAQERSLGLAAAIFAAGFIVNGIDDRDDTWAHAAATTGGDPSRGEAMFIQYGCGACHRVAHVRKAMGMVGPPLDGIAVRAMIAGKLDNSPGQSGAVDPRPSSGQPRDRDA